MKKLFIGSLVGAIILFIWSFYAWAISSIHLHTYMHTPLQDSIMNTLAENNMETGAYVMPMADNRNIDSKTEEYDKQSQELMGAGMGKPSAVLYYTKAMEFNMGTLLRGFLFEFLTVFAACILLLPGFAATSSFFGRWWLTLIVGLLLSAAGPLMRYNFMGEPWSFAIDMIVDTFLNWGIVGLWLAWYFRK